jgi:hypothetical protein
MANDRATTRYRRFYARLLRLYPRAYRERFGEAMAQTFSDLCRERTDAGQGLFTLALWAFGDTFIGMLREHFSRVIQMRNKNIIRWVIATTCLLLVPLVAMQFTSEVVWSTSDFVFAGGLLFGAGLVYELVARQGDQITYRAAVGVALATALLLVWANAAVGLIGSEDNPANFMYGAVLAVGVVGAVIARFRPVGMARTLLATALAQALVAAIALVAGMDQAPGSSVAEIVNVNGFFVALWLLSAGLFRGAARRPPTAVAGLAG